MTDDQGHGDFGFTGNTVVRTPNLDALAGRAARMTNFYVSPVCAPTRASLMTGRYNYRTRVRDTYIGRAMMDPDELTVAEVLRDHGYATGIFGKWHLGDNYPMRPMDQGFERSLVIRGGGIGQPSDPPGGESKYTDPILLDQGKLKPFKGYCTDIFFNQALSFIEKSKRQGRPFFAYIPTNAPHGPFGDVPRDLYEYYKGFDYTPWMKGRNIAKRIKNGEGDRMARIFAMITNIDDNVGRLFARLDQLGLTDDTMVIFLHDNGPNSDRYVSQMRGMKGGVHEGGIRSVFWVQWPGRVMPGQSSDRIAAHIDVMPTILDACGIAVPSDRKIDGRSLLPLLEGRQVEWPDRMITVQWHRGDVPLRYHQFGARTQRWKLLNASGANGQGWDGQPKFELYDKWSDPFEWRNLADERPDVLARLRAQYDAWFDDVSTTRPDNWEAPLIDLGTPHENPTTLTRQDWHHVKGRQWGPYSQGYWGVHVAESGRYDFHLRFPRALEHGGTARVKVGEQSSTVRVPAGAKKADIHNVNLKQGDGQLWTILNDGDRESGVLQVDVERVR